MQINSVMIEDTFAEAFPMWLARLVITADTPYWAQTAARYATGLAISVVGCACEAGLDAPLSEEKTPDGRPGVGMLIFGFTRQGLEKTLITRIGQAVLTTPTTACFNGLESQDQAKIGAKVRFFGNGFQSSKVIGDTRYWRIPTADGEFLVQESFGISQGVGGGNFLILGEDRASALKAAEAAAAAIDALPGVIAPFPGGICRSPSQPGSRYTGLRASTNAAFCPTLRNRVATKLPDNAQAAYEIVLDGVTVQAVSDGMRDGIRAACLPGIISISAGNYGGKLGPYHFHLHQILQAEAPCV
ncbi:MAG: formylmethanofuran--tetrahydromethanopterin N-formyltransferase [Anaerolineales bacterium]|nr:formylmethanofuran--tetrahydromethanopterin N-formyltransferase [Anaerolineales bacterium]